LFYEQAAKLTELYYIRNDECKPNIEVTQWKRHSYLRSCTKNILIPEIVIAFFKKKKALYKEPSKYN